MTAFLEKLRRICTSCPEDIGGWSADGCSFEVRSPKFQALLKNYFKGTVKTFIRQLHFYGFSKSEAVNGKWSFAHPKLNRNNPDSILEITRKTRMNAVAYTPREDFEGLRKQVKQLEEVVSRDIGQIKTQIESLWKVVNTLSTQLRDSRNLMNEPEQYKHFPDLKLRKISPFPYDSQDDIASTGSQPLKKKLKISSTSSLSDRPEASDPVLDFMMEGFALPVRDCDIDLIKSSPLFSE